MSDKKREKVEKFVGCWEQDCAKTEREWKNTKQEIDARLATLQDEIMSMNKYSPDAVGGKADAARSELMILKNKLSFLDSINK